MLHNFQLSRHWSTSKRMPRPQINAHCSGDYVGLMLITYKLYTPQWRDVSPALYRVGMKN